MSSVPIETAPLTRACIHCHRVKAKCSREIPCSRCLRVGVVCQPRPRAPRRPRPLLSSPSLNHPSSSGCFFNFSLQSLSSVPLSLAPPPPPPPPQQNNNNDNTHSNDDDNNNGKSNEKQRDKGEGSPGKRKRPLAMLDLLGEEEEEEDFDEEERSHEARRQILFVYEAFLRDSSRFAQYNSLPFSSSSSSSSSSPSPSPSPSFPWDPLQRLAFQNRSLFRDLCGIHLDQLALSLVPFLGKKFDKKDPFHSVIQGEGEVLPVSESLDDVVFLVFSYEDQTLRWVNPSAEVLIPREACGKSTLQEVTSSFSHLLGEEGLVEDFTTAEQDLSEALQRGPPSLSPSKLDPRSLYFRTDTIAKNNSLGIQTTFTLFTQILPFFHPSSGKPLFFALVSVRK